MARIRAGLTQQEDFIADHRENLPGNILGRLAEVNKKYSLPAAKQTANWE